MRTYSLYRHISPNGKCMLALREEYPFNGGGRTDRAILINRKWLAPLLNMVGGNVRHEILLTDLTESEAKFWEQFYIRQFDTVKNGYNITSGGDGLTGVKLSEETKRKIGEANRQKNYPGNPDVLKDYISQHGGRKVLWRVERSHFQMCSWWSKDCCRLWVEVRR